MKILALSVFCFLTFSIGCSAADTGNDNGDLQDTLAIDADDTGSENGGCLPDPDITVTTDTGTDTSKDTIQQDPGPQDPGSQDLSTHDDITDAGPTDHGTETDTAPDDTIPETSDDGSGDTDATEPLECPNDMVPVKNICMDKYEASRPDATSTTPGTDETMAVSRAGVIPWYVTFMSVAVRDKFSAACQAAGKRLCAADEFYDACSGPNQNTYFFGNTWNPETCNSVDTYCDDHCVLNDISPCNLAENCGYQYYCFRVAPTGAFPDCTNEYGLFDVNGNVWEIVPTSDERGYQVRGGAFNCGGPSVRLQCGFDATWNDLMAGFRCCLDPQ